MYQRATATLVDSATLRFLSRYGLPLMALQPQDEKALNELLESQLPPAVEQALTAVSTLISERMEALAQVVPLIDPTLEGTVRTTQGKMQHEMQTLHNKVIHAAKRKDETVRRQFQRAQNLSLPPRAPAGARSRLRLVPEPLRPGAGHAARRGGAARHGPALRAQHLGVRPSWPPVAPGSPGSAAACAAR